MATTTTESALAGTGQVERKPLMSGPAILMMNLGFFGVQFSFGLTQSAVNPLFLLIGASPEQLPILNLAGPVTGLIIQPMIGAFSDRTWSPRWGRRRPFVTAGAILCAIILFAFPFVGVLWLAVICFWLLDAGNNTSMEPYRALISDRLPKSQLARGFLTQSMFTGAGAVLANISLFVLQKVTPLQKNAGNGVPYWMYVCFIIGTFCILLTVLTAMARTKELTPSEEDLAEIRSTPKGVGHAVREIASAVRAMPVAMHKIGLVFVFQWYAMFIYWQFLAVSLGETIFGANPEQGGKAWDDSIAWSGLENATYNFVTMISALFLVGFARRIGAKRVHAVALGLAAVSLIWLARIDNEYLALVPMIGVGIFWASAVGVPYLMVASMVPAKRTGVYMGILNMMIVVPMLVQTVTFGWIFEHLLDSKGSNAITLAGVLLGIGAVVMLWVNPPDEADESPIVPLGAASPCTTGWWSVPTAPRPACTPWTGPPRWPRPRRRSWWSSPRTGTPIRVRRASPRRASTRTCSASTSRATPWTSRSPGSPRSGRATSSSGSCPATRRRRCSTRSAPTRPTSSSSATVGWAPAGASCSVRCPGTW